MIDNYQHRISPGQYLPILLSNLLTMMKTPQAFQVIFVIEEEVLMFLEMDAHGLTRSAVSTCRRSRIGAKHG